MADALDNIFSALVKSEMIAHVGKQKHKEAKGAIEHLKLRLKKQESQKSQHVSKKFQLGFAVADANIAIKILKVKEEMMSNELKTVEEKVRTEENRHDAMNKRTTDEYEDFVEDVKKFSTDYGLSSSGIDRRILCTKEHLRSLEIDKNALESDVDAIRDSNDGLNTLLDEKSREKRQLVEILSNIDDIDREIDAELTCINQLENQISQLVTEPDSGSEFMRIKQELEEYEVTELQADIDKLQTELNTSARKLKKKEAQSLRLQFRNWQRQKHQKSHDHSNSNDKDDTSGDTDKESVLQTISLNVNRNTAATGTAATPYGNADPFVLQVQEDITTTIPSTPDEAIKVEAS